MFLNTEQEIKEWLNNNTSLQEKDIDSLEFENINNQLEINVIIKKDFPFFCMMLKDNVNELKVKFNKINTGFYIQGEFLESFNGFPNFINGNLQSTGCSYKHTNNWPLKQVNGDINLCSNNTNFENLKFLKETKFESIYLKVYNSMFVDNIILEECKKYCKDIDNGDIKLHYKQIQIILNDYKNEDNDLNNYLNLFDNELEIKKG